MSEPVLMALVQLFAIVAANSRKGTSGEARLVLSTYLRQHLGSTELEEYLKLYDELVLFHQPAEGDSPDNEVTIGQIAEIAQKIYSNLQHRERLIIFLRFLEFVRELSPDFCGPEGQAESGKDLAFEMLAGVFSLTGEEVSDCRNFILGDPEIKATIRNMVVISGQVVQGNTVNKTLLRDLFPGILQILYIPSVRLFAGRYEGEEELYLNGQVIQPLHTFLFSAGSIIRNPKISPVYYSDIASCFLKEHETSSLSFTADEVSFRFKNSPNGIQPFSFTAYAGELIGVMGGSGVGKSTLLNLLNGSLPPDKGDILINGHSLNREAEKLRGVIGFVPQDDLLMEELTVFQNLYYNARLCFRNFSRMQLLRPVVRTLKDIGLGKIRNLKVGDPLNKFISGGQRKRLNIALELIREPSILFADEPTSGLSSNDSEMVMLLLKEQTVKGKLVIVNIHQPSSDIFRLFDKLLIIDTGGYPIYYGNPLDAVTWFKTISNHVNPDRSECELCGYVNPEQLLQITEARTVNEFGTLTATRKVSPADWYQHFRKSIQPSLPIDRTVSSPPGSPFRIPGKISQFLIFCRRNLLARSTNTQYLIINLLEAPLLAAILAYLTRWHQGDSYQFSGNPNLVAYLFMSVVVALFIGMMVSAEEIFRDRRILKREAFLQLSHGSYLISKVLFLFALSAIQTLLYVLIGNYILGIRGMMLHYWLILFTTACFANLIGLNISAGLDSIVAIYILIPFILVPQLLLSGTIVPFDKLNPSISSQERVPLVGNMMISRWAYEALAVEQFRNNRYEKIFYKYDKQISHYTYLTAFKIPEMQSMMDVCLRNLVRKSDLRKTEQNFEILLHEFPLLQQEAGFGPESFLAALHPMRFTDHVRNVAGIWLDSVSRVFSSRLSAVNRQHDIIYSSLENQFGRDGMVAFRDNYYNENLADFVTDRSAMTKIIAEEGKLIRKKDPIFMDPVSHNGSAHFYAPVKILGSWQIDTLWFNMCVIWICTILLYILLAMDGVRKGIALFRRH